MQNLYHLTRPLVDDDEHTTGLSDDIVPEEEETGEEAYEELDFNEYGPDPDDFYDEDDLNDDEYLIEDEFVGRLPFNQQALPF